MKYTRYGQCIATDTCEFEVSTPFGFKYLVTFLDLATKYLFIYFTRTHTHSEMRNVIVQFMADAKPYLSKGHVELWFMDNGSEYGVPFGVGNNLATRNSSDSDRCKIG